MTRELRWCLNGDTYEVVPEHGDMQWRRADGSIAEYTGPLDDLGYGIPRNPRSAWGIRRALFDLAYGYVSGFPMLDVLAFSARSLLPTQEGMMSSRDLDPDGTDSYHPEHPWEQAGHALYLRPDERTQFNWPPVAAHPAGPHEAEQWRRLPVRIPKRPEQLTFGPGHTY